MSYFKKAVFSTAPPFLILQLAAGCLHPLGQSCGLDSDLVDTMDVFHTSDALLFMTSSAQDSLSPSTYLLLT